MLVAIVATVFLVPYIQLQIQGMGVVMNAMSYGGVDLHVAAVVSFVVAGVIGLVANLIVNACVSYARPDARVAVITEEAS
jgi:SSS family solute:Na+ symporter